MKQTEVTCPVCHTKFNVLAEHEHVESNVRVLGKDSGLGTIELPVKEVGRVPSAASAFGVAPKANKADERLAALKAAGVDTTGFVAMTSASGEGFLFRMTDSGPVVVNDDDPIFQSLVKGAQIPERRLFRRFIAAQYLSMLFTLDYATRKADFTAALKRKGYEYTWKMLVEELRVQAIICDRDPEVFYERIRWFNANVAMAMADDYIAKVTKHFESLKTKHCKGIPYKTFHGTHIFVEDFTKKHLSKFANAKNGIRLARNPKELYDAVRKFDNIRFTFKWETPQCREWMDAYKGAGAYFTLQNLIRFSGIRLMQGSYMLDTASSEALLREYAMGHKGWWMLGLVKEALKYNNFDYEATRREWRERKARR